MATQIYTTHNRLSQSPQRDMRKELERERQRKSLLLTFQREGWESEKDHGWAPKRLFRDGDGTLENTQPSQIGGRRDEERGESIEGEEKDWISDFPQSWMIVSICVCVAAIV